jgi:hypothetical protein
MILIFPSNKLTPSAPNYDHTIPALPESLGLSDSILQSKIKQEQE